MTEVYALKKKRKRLLKVGISKVRLFNFPLAFEIFFCPLYHNQSVFVDHLSLKMNGIHCLAFKNCDACYCSRVNSQPAFFNSCNREYYDYTVILENLWNQELN